MASNVKILKEKKGKKKQLFYLEKNPILRVDSKMLFIIPLASKIKMTKRNLSLLIRYISTK